MNHKILERRSGMSHKYSGSIIFMIFFPPVCYSHTIITLCMAGGGGEGVAEMV
jgi:hypothetical protein